MKAKFSFLYDERYRSLIYSILVLGLFIGGLTYVNNSDAKDGGESTNSLSPFDDPNFPLEFDTRAIHGTPRGTELFQPTAIQVKALNSLATKLGLSNSQLLSGVLNIQYNGLTATPKHLFVRGGYLSEPSAKPPELIARNFLSANKGLFRFSEDDLNSMKVTSRATHPGSGTTTFLFTQQKDGLYFFNGAVLVNVAKNGQILNVGGESYPSLNITNASTISASQAVSAAATDLGLSGYSLNSEGPTQVLSAYGDLKPEFTTGEKFTSNGFFGDDINVTKVVFPQGATGRIVYRFTLTTPQYMGVMWENFVDAQTGQVLRRHSLTSFQKSPRSKPNTNARNTSNLGATGGGVGVGRKPSYRPDIQNMVEGYNNAGTAQGKVFDTIPTLLSGYRGFGRATRTGSSPADFVYTSPGYSAPLTSGRATGRGFSHDFVKTRNEQALPFAAITTTTTFNHSQLPGILGQITRGFPDAANPSSGSPFGWFYLPTGTSGTEITTANSNRSTTKAVGYTMSPEAIARNQAYPDNSPNGATGDQPFAADVTPLSSSVTLNDGRVLNSVFESKYTEGNAVFVADDRENNNETNHGIKGYSSTRNFTAPYFDYYASYEFGPDATGGTGMVTTYPVTANADLAPGAATLFYMNNVLHDYLYEVGFTEQFWNFQMDNFGKGGAGGDSVSAQVQDGSGTNNANFGTPADGGTPRMQMYLFTEGTFRRADGDFDFDVIAHELYHGVSNRSAAKGGTGCLGLTMVGESNGMGEGWGDAIGASMTDDDALGEFVTGEQDTAIRRLPQANYRWSYGTVNQNVRFRRDGLTPDANPGSTPFQVHAVGELWSSTVWDMRELLIMKNAGASFYDGNRRLGSGVSFFIGGRQVNSVDTNHPINYRASFNTTSGTTPTVNATEHIVRPGLIAAENQANPNRNGPIATATAKGAKLSDMLVLRGLQLTPCNPSFVDMRDSILLADQELTGGENQAIIWRAFASHGVGTGATSTGGAGDDQGSQSAPVVVENFDVPAGVTECETLGPLAAPTFTATSPTANQARLTINNVLNATKYVIARSNSANGPFATIATINAATGLTTTFTDNDSGQGISGGQTLYYQVHAVRNPQCIGTANTQSVSIAGGTIAVAPVFFGVGAVTDTRSANSLSVSWSPAISNSTTANIVYNVYRVESVTTSGAANPTAGMVDSTTPPKFTPSTANLIAENVNGNSFTDKNVTLGQIYYYVVQALDTDNGMLDTNGTGNTFAKFAAPTSNNIASTPFNLEDFESASANLRFTPALVDTNGPQDAQPVWQRASGVDFLVGESSKEAAESLVQTTTMYAPDFDPAQNTGGGSDIRTVIGPVNLTETSVMEFRNRFTTEAAFDGGVIEIAVGSPNFNANPFPDNITTYDINYFAYEAGYTGKLNGELAAGVTLSTLQGRFAFDGVRANKLTRIALGEFAPGGEFNAANQPVYIRFRMTSDAATNAGAGSGWYIDDLVINSFGPNPLGIEADVSPRPLGDGVINSGDVIGIRRFANGSDTFTNSENEFQRADVSPRVSLGDGQINAGDVIQVRRYGNNSDPITEVGGPTLPQSFKYTENSLFGRSGDRSIQVLDTKAEGRKVTVQLAVNAEGDEAGYGFTLDYDKEILGNPVVVSGKAGGNVMANTKVPGRIGFSLDYLGETVTSGRGQNLLTITFDINTRTKSSATALKFSDNLAIRSVANLNADLMPIQFVDGKVILSPTRIKSKR